MDFKFLQNPISRKWVILAPRRAKRPDVAHGFEPICPFCVGREGDEEELYKVSSTVTASEARQSQEIASSSATPRNDDEGWLVRVLPNKFPFAPIHEIVIHSPDHGKNFDKLPMEHVGLILKTYRQRFLLHRSIGHVYIFHNRGEGGGESLPHPHTQIAVVPFDVKMDIPRLDPNATVGFGPKPLTVISSSLSLRAEGLSEAKDLDSSPAKPDQNGNPENEEQVAVVTDHFYLFCPKTSQWPDEVWVAPKSRGRSYGEITDEEISDLAFILGRLIGILELRNGSEQLPFNFYIYPGGDWYLRLTPRLKTLGGFEIGTGVYINTQDPKEIIAFIKEHFENPDEEKIKRENQAEYSRHA